MLILAEVVGCVGAVILYNHLGVVTHNNRDVCTIMMQRPGFSRLSKKE